MIVKKIFLNNFTSFYGKHMLQLEKGVNFVVGTSGSGKTNLARAFEFAVLGHVDTPRNTLFNFKHRQECLEKSQNPFCQVEVEIQHENRDYLIQSGLGMIGDKDIKQPLTIAPEIDSIITSKTFQHVCLNPLSLDSAGEDKDHSTATRITRSVLKHLMLNVEAGIKMAILDRILEQLSSKYREQLLGVIGKMALEQLMITASPRVVPPNFEDHPIIHHIEFNEERFSSKIVK